MLDEGRWGTRCALLVVDVVEPFVDQPFARACVDNIVQLLNAARRNGIPIWFTRGGMNYYLKARDLAPVERGAWQWRNPHQQPSDGGERYLSIPSVFHRRPSEPVITKGMPSAFFGTPLASQLNFANIDTLIVAGVMTSGCIRATVTDAFSYNFRVIVPRECVADRDLDAHEANLRDIEKKYGWVIGLDEVVRELDRRGAVS